MYEKQTALQPLVTSRTADKTQRHWMRFVRTHFIRPAQALPPRSLSIPDRVWRRQSALIMSFHETKEDG